MGGWVGCLPTLRFFSCLGLTSLVGPSWVVSFLTASSSAAEEGGWVDCWLALTHSLEVTRMEGRNFMGGERWVGGKRRWAGGWDI